VPDDVRRLKAASEHPLTVSGPNLAAQAFASGLLDECHLFVAPAVLGAGKSAFPQNVEATLDLRALDRFDNGVVHLHYAVGR
jgi:dihydrofolate reductase